jgi:hypothetical protein
MSSSFSYLLFDTVKGETKSFREYWDSFMDAILKKVTDNMANMVTEWLLGINKMSSASSSSGLMGLISSGIGLVASLFGGGGTTAPTTAPTTSFGQRTSVGTFEFHNGGIVGESSVPIRQFPSYAFAGAPRFHNGFLPDEYPAVLKRGEGVFTPKQMKGIGSVSKSSNSNTTVNIYALDSKSFEEYAKKNSSVIQGVVMQGLRDNKTRSETKKLLS